LATLERIHALLNVDLTKVQLPLCTQCATTLRTVTKNQIHELEEELECYKTFMKEFEMGTPYSPSEDPSELQTLHEEEMELEAELNNLEAEEARLEMELAHLELEDQQLNEEEEQFWMELNGFQQNLAAFQTERDALNTKYDIACQQLERLKKTNVYNDVFRIWHDGVFGTISGFRLGRHPSQPVRYVFQFM
jgi:beclin 1